MNINCIIIDDEPLARKGLTEYISNVDFLTLAGAYEDALKAATAISENDIRLLFLDIELPRISGLDFLKSLQHPPLIILTTAYPQYALEGFDLNVLDYLVKPISFPRFLKAVTKAKEQLQLMHQTITAPASSSDAEDYIFIKTNNKLVRIFFYDILFVEALQNYVAIHTTEKKFISYLTFKSVEDKLPREKFLKVHKSFIVQISKVDAFENNELQVGASKLPVSRSLKDEVLKKIFENKYLKR
jgi:DNA-binding LytR/AlgR family response regulator